MPGILSEGKPTSEEAVMNGGCEGSNGSCPLVQDNGTIEMCPLHRNSSSPDSGTVYSCVCMCVRVHVHVCMHACVCVCVHAFGKLAGSFTLALSSSVFMHAGEP